MFSIFSSQNFIRFLFIFFYCNDLTAKANNNFAIRLGNPYKLCPQTKGGTSWECKNNQKHYLCVNTKVSRSCKKFKLIKLSGALRNIFINSHNGLRNKIANDFGIADMNLIYWSPELELMALLFLRKCQIEMDSCAVIGENAFEVGQTFAYTVPKRTRMWPGYIVRSWYLELGQDIHTGADYLKKYRENDPMMQNFTQISWPYTEFFGCASAFMSEMQHIVCFYYPKANPEKWTDVKLPSKPCSKCVDRTDCSTIYEELCGVDMDNNSQRISEQSHQYTIVTTVLLACICRYINE